MSDSDALPAASAPSSEALSAAPLPLKAERSSLFAGFPSWLPPLFYLVLALLFLWRSLLTGDVFLPATLLGHIAPWKYSPYFHDLPPWNPLRWDGIGQFYPWRHFAAETLRSGSIPLWNPYQFCGTPFVANSQSAVLYPGNLLFLLIPDTAYAFGWSALLHLTLCGWFTHLLLRRLRCSEPASLLGGVVYAYSAWQVSWLQLPTFLATSCWIPLLLYAIQGVGGKVRGVGEDRATASESSAVSLHLPYTLLPLAAVLGLMLLAGHLQIAFYGLLAGTLWAVWLLLFGGRERRAERLAVYIGGLALGLMLAMPQLLPAIELSRISHRVGKPSAGGYTAYTEYGLPPSGLAMLLLPDFFGGDADPANPYWGYYRKRLVNGQVIAVYHNPAETALYVGIVPLLFGLLACLRGLNRKTPDRRTAFFAGLALFALLLALGTPLDALLYFGIPGFGQSGSPARCLVLWTLAGSVLAALGLDSFRAAFPTKRELAIIGGILVGVFALTLNLGAQALHSPPPGIKSLPTTGEVFERIGMDWLRLGLFAFCGAGVLAWPLLRAGLSPEPSSPGPFSHAAGEGKKDTHSSDLSAEDSMEEETNLHPSALPLEVSGEGKAGSLDAAVLTPDALGEEETSGSPSLPLVVVLEASPPPVKLSLSPSSPVEKRDKERPRPAAWLSADVLALIALVLVIADLFWAGIGINPTAKREQVYPETAGITYLREHTGHARVFPVNQHWSLFAPLPVILPAVLPPNAATVYGLRDVQGYDSLFAGAYKAFANRFARPNRLGAVDASPPEVGNMVFFQNPNASETPEIGAAFAIMVPYSAPGFASQAAPPTTPVDTGDAGMTVYELPRAPRAALEPSLPDSALAWREDSPERVTLTVSASAPSLLILRDTLLPGWRAFVDEKPAALIGKRDNPVYRSVSVPVGQHTVAFRYTPMSFRAGLYCLLLACMLLTAGCLLRFIAARFARDTSHRERQEG